MARASRRNIPGFIWHITDRCQKREFLLRFRKDRHRWQYEALMNLAGYQNYDTLRVAHKGWIETEIGRFGGGRQPHWTESIAVGSSAFVEPIQQQLSFRSLGRRKRPLPEGMELRESPVLYNEFFEPEKAHMEPKNREF